VFAYYWYKVAANALKGNWQFTLDTHATPKFKYKKFFAKKKTEASKIHKQSRTMQ